MAIRRRLTIFAILLHAMLHAMPAFAQAPPKLLDWPDLLNRPMPRATERIAYGQGKEQFGELWLPTGSGPFPVVLMVHGGCWLSSVAQLSIMNYAAEDLRVRGIAVWNIEYRGVDRAGGGYPGTFQDVAAASDLLRGLASKYHLRIDRVVALGHSAGGHLAPWLAARGRIPKTSLLYSANPLPIKLVLSLGGLPDLEDARARGEDACGAGTVDKLVGVPTTGRADVYADTSPVRLGRTSAKQLLINGDRDTIAPVDSARSYLSKMKTHGQAIENKVVPNSGHVELIAPESAAWDATVKAVESALSPQK